jgi:flagellar motor switch/type III secretory pathway protein FliN
MTAALTLPKPVAVPDGGAEELWKEAGWLPCLFSVDLPLKRFTVRDLLQLEVGSVLETRIAESADVPVVVNGQLIGWAEFELTGKKIAVRMTEIG